jgi:hypothetical protein
LATPVQFSNGPLPQAPNATLTSAIAASGAATPTVDVATYLPAAGPFLLVIDDERLEVDTIAGTTLSILAGGRGLEGTSPVAHSSGAPVYQVLSAATLARTIDDRAAKGWLDKATGGNVTLSTTAGVYSDIVTGGVFTPGVNRRLKVLVWFAANLLIGGSGFSTADTWQAKWVVSVGGGAFADVPPGPTYLVRAQVAQTMRYGVAPQMLDYVTGPTPATLQFKWQMSKTSGAATVTSDWQSTTHQLVEDVGPV